MKSQVKTNPTPDSGIVTLWIDSYSDIFSDFDPRPFSQRVVSDDFITQVKRVSRENKARANVLRLLVPEGTQKADHERIIKNRLQTYFQNISVQLREEGRALKKRGMIFTAFGIALMVIATYVSFLELSQFAFKMLLALFEPGGWFLLWTGLELMIGTSWKKRNELVFFERFENIHVEFNSYKMTG